MWESAELYIYTHTCTWLFLAGFGQVGDAGVRAHEHGAGVQSSLQKTLLRLRHMDPTECCFGECVSRNQRQAVHTHLMDTVYRLAHTHTHTIQIRRIHSTTHCSGIEIVCVCTFHVQVLKYITKKIKILLFIIQYIIHCHQILM